VNVLSTKPSVFALNFCDEGYANDALKELHIPALLEACDVHYSGAGPVSLAICYDKGLVNSTAAKLGIPTPKESYVIIPTSQDLEDVKFDYLERIILEKEEISEIQYPSFVKPMKVRVL
jgi:D-alanine-D-alanine ligase-like ATP-grasp enzyme